MEEISEHELLRLMGRATGLQQEHFKDAIHAYWGPEAGDGCPFKIGISEFADLCRIADAISRDDAIVRIDGQIYKRASEADVIIQDHDGESVAYVRSDWTEFV